MTPVTRKVRVKVPATSANLGSGFDTVGLALDYHDELEFTLSADPVNTAAQVMIEGEGEDTLPRDETHLVVSTFRRACQTFGLGKVGFILEAHNNIPQARGMGSSAEAIVAGIAAAAAFAQEDRLNRDSIFELAAAIEGHPDNVAPAIYGGLSVSIMVDGKTLTNSIPIDDDLSFITVSPEVEVSTEEARKALPKTIDYQSAVFNVSRVSFLVSSLFTKQYDRIAYGLQDKLHVPYRLRLIPSGELVLKKAVEAGALGATISGSGSTLIAFATDQEVQIMDAMINCFNDHGIAATGHILKCSNEGAKLVE
mgnify:CR=1 FL=1